MTTELLLPKFNMDMESAVLVRWLVEDGARVSSGDPVAEVETDKVNMEVEATADGILCALRYSPGDIVPVPTAIASIAPDEAAAEAARASFGRDGGSDSAAVTEEPRPAAEQGIQPLPPTPVGAPSGQEEVAPPSRVDEVREDRIRATPAIRRRAREYGIDLATLATAGGRVTPSALQAAIEQQSAPAGSERPQVQAARPSPAPATADDGVRRAPLDATRRAIAERMTRAGQVPQITLTIEARLGDLVSVRDASVARPSFSAIFAVAVARAIRDHPLVNSVFEDGIVTTYSAVHLGIAVARPAGLIVPVVRDLDRLTVVDIDGRIRDLVTKAREGRLQLAEVSGGTFTITSLGEAGVDQFTPLLNPPQVAILAIGRIARRLVPMENGILVEPTVHLSLACDHRVIDGQPGAAFLATMKALLEQPAWLAANLEARGSPDAG